MPVASAGTNSETSPMKVPLVNDLVTSIGKIHSEIAKDTKIGKILSCTACSFHQTGQEYTLVELVHIFTKH